jgi:hypothetical protein
VDSNTSGPPGSIPTSPVLAHQTVPPGEVTAISSKGDRQHRGDRRCSWTSRADHAGERWTAHVAGNENRRDRGLWMIVDASTNMPITGLRYELNLEDIEAFLDVRT